MSGARWLWVSAAVIVADRATKYAIERDTSPFSQSKAPQNATLKTSSTLLPKTRTAENQRC